MPAIRVVQRHNRAASMGYRANTNYGQQAKSPPAGLFGSSSTDSRDPLSTFSPAGGEGKRSGYLSPLYEASTEKVPTAYRKPRLNYELMMHRIQKMIQGELKPASSKEEKLKFEAATPHHRFNPSQVAMRKACRHINDNRSTIVTDNLN